jgi:hypothetical protein
MSNFLKLPRAAQRAAFAHMGDKGRGRFSGSLTAGKPDDRGRIAGTLPETGSGQFKGTLPAAEKRSKRLGAGDRHAALTAKTEHKPPGQKEIDDLRKAFEKGHSSGEELDGGVSADAVEKVKLSNGKFAVRKEQSERDTRAEYLSSRVANALGIKEVTVAQTGDRETVAAFIKGEPGSVRMMKALASRQSEGGKRAALDDELKQQMKLKNAREIGMLDWLIDNDDRHELNWMVSPDGKSVVPIDHGSANFEAQTHMLTGASKVPRSPFVDEWIRPELDDNEGFKSANPQWTPAEISEIRSSIEGLRSEFRSPEEQKWHQFMMSRLQMLRAK